MWLLRVLVFLNLSILIFGGLLFDINRDPRVSTVELTDDGQTFLAVKPIIDYQINQKRVNRFYVSLNGLVSLNQPLSPFNICNWEESIRSAGAPFMAPLWIDVKEDFVGKLHQRQSIDVEELKKASEMVASRRSLKNINSTYLFLVEWDNTAPCNVGHFLRNRFQLAVVTDECASYAIYSYHSISWGIDKGTKVTFVDEKGIESSYNGTVKELENYNLIVHLGGENACTGRPFGALVGNTEDSTKKTYYRCLQCNPTLLRCPGNEVFEPLCGGCANGTFPNCDGTIHGGWSIWINEGVCMGECGVGSQFQFRICDNPPPSGGGRECEGESLRSVDCQLRRGCLVNGAWSEWSESPCSQSCGDGNMTRLRTCNNPSPQNGGLNCTGSSSEVVACNIKNCAIDGNWSQWENEGECSRTCGPGSRLQRRFCNTPKPQYGGLNCIGNSTQFVDCFLTNCPINGNWNNWAEFGTCSKSCDGGLISERRTCTNPSPQYNGTTCIGETERRTKVCNTNKCPDICTIQDAGDNQFVYDPEDLSYYCLCMRTVDNSQSFIEECYQCNAGTRYIPDLTSCGVKVDLKCEPDPFCVGKLPGRNYSINYGQANAKCSNMYYFCDDNLQMHEFTCGMNMNGVYFDPDTGICAEGNPPADGCQNSYCVGRPNGNYDRLDDFCRRYYHCESFVMSIQMCTGFYDVTRKTCVNTDNPPDATCIHPLCASKTDGTYVKDDTCTGYYHCANRRQTEAGNCPLGQYFDGSACNATYPGPQCQHLFCRNQLRNGVAGSFSLVGSSCFAEYIVCSGQTTTPPNQGLTSKCSDHQYFGVDNLQNWLGSCKNSPPASSCANYRCIGRPNGYRVPFDGHNDCTQYYQCNNQVSIVQKCPIQSPYFNGVECSGIFNETACQHADCLLRGQNINYPVIAGSECSASYYNCDVNLYRTLKTCSPSLVGSYFGKNNDGGFQCVSGDAPSSCADFPGYLCIGKVLTVDNNPLYKDPTDNYCQNYISCNSSTQGVVNRCPNNDRFSPTKGLCTSEHPPGCWRDGGLSTWSEWQYTNVSACSVTCGPGGAQIQQRLRTCTNPTPLGQGLACVGLQLNETRMFSCEVTPPECGDAFCRGRSAGNYSKSLLLQPPINKACFRNYLVCSGPPQNILSSGSCGSADYVFSPNFECQLQNLDADCPANECSRKVDGLHPFSGVHDCRKYLDCLNEFETILNCPTDANNRQLYFNPQTKTCDASPQDNCNPVFGFWSSWFNDSDFCFISNGQCQQRQIRKCSNPPPLNDPNACPGDNERFQPCNNCVDPCSVVPNPCVGSNAVCLSTPNQGVGYQCSCPSGYTRSGQGNEVICLDINECSTSPCHVDGTCTNTPGSFQCTCQSYYRGNGFQCIDINECDERIDNCNSNAQCRNVIGNPGFSCQCNNGFQGDGVSCTDLNECVLNTNSCHLNADCLNNIGSYSCLCRNGYQGNGFTCADVNECQLPTDSCHQNADCINTVGSYVCSCKAGFTGNGLDCVDVNECNTNGGGCHTNANCFNNVGSYNCVCKEGYTGNGFTCTDKDECASGENICHQNGNCLNNQGSYTCACKQGYSGNGVTCFDVNECTNGSSGCHVNANCTNTPGSYTCTCNNGYQGDGRNCSAINGCGDNNCDVNARCEIGQSGNFQCICNNGFVGSGMQCNDSNECASNTHSCHVNAQCINTVGSYQCQCNTFYKGDGRTCVDINECDENQNNCNVNANCINLLGSGFSCQCKTGWTGDGITCNDFNECEAGTSNCSVNADCRNLIGNGFTCACRNGYTGDGQSCTDKNECILNTDNCHDNADCINAPGSFKCLCKQGFTGDGVNICSDIDECQTGTAKCDLNAECENRIGSFTCTCKPGYNGSGVVCQDINECSSTTLNTCHANAECINLEGSFSCRCQTGYEGNGQTCSDVNECMTSTLNDCSVNANCSNSVGNYSCSCKDGFQGDGKTCTAISKCEKSPCHVNALCQDLENSQFRCICNSGYVGDGFDCQDKNECTLGEFECHQAASCVNTVGSYTCQCKAGYIGNGKNCTDINECVVLNPCDVNADCSNTVGSYMCSCKSGYTGNGRSCSDLNECASSSLNSCDVNAVCTNTAGSYNCQCKSGYTGNGFVCSDVNECTSSTLNSCDVNAVCTNTAGSYNCQCKSGYTGNGFVCSGAVATCVGRNNGDRIENVNDATGRTYLQCNNNEGVLKSCPSATFYTFDAQLGFFSYINGVIFSPYFKTCVNTTTLTPHPKITTLEESCRYIEDNFITGAGTKLPLPNMPECNSWIVCENHQLKNINDPVAGTCEDGLKYDADNANCDSVTAVQCRFF